MEDNMSTSAKLLQGKKRFIESNEKIEPLEQTRTNLLKIHPDSAYIIEPFAVLISKINTETGRIIHWEKGQGYSLWQIIKSAS
jgi:hypothetical protein